jgi:hypothetical protein
MDRLAAEGRRRNKMTQKEKTPPGRRVRWSLEGKTNGCH